MSDEDVTSTRLRIGGWLPSYQARGRHALPEPVIKPPHEGRADVRRAAPEPAVETTGAAVRGPGRVVLASVTALIVLLLLALVSVHRGGIAPATLDTPSAAARPGIGQDLPEISWLDGFGVAASPSATTAGPSSYGTAGHAVDGTRGTPAWSAGNRTVPPSAAPKPSSPADVPLTAGTRIGLAPVTTAGYRVRHRDFVGRIDLIGPGSSALDKADSSFTVRPGLADSRCVSFESVNYPGYYLRHQNFRIYLHRRDGTWLFAADATFCPVTGLTGQHTSFRSVNYPSRYLRHRDSKLYLDPFDGDDRTRAAMTFAVKAAWW